VGKSPKTGTKIRFKPDTEMFEVTEYSFDTVSNRLRELSFLNRGIKVVLYDERTEKNQEYFSEGGLKSFVEYLNRAKTKIHDEVIYFYAEATGIFLEVAMQWNDTYKESIFTFANNINTIEGGTHLAGLKTALTKCVNKYIDSSGLSKDLGEGLQGEDVREGLTAVISVKIPQPQFEGQTKTKLGNGEVKGMVENLLNERLSIFLDENPGEAKRIASTVLVCFTGSSEKICPAGNFSASPQFCMRVSIPSCTPHKITWTRFACTRSTNFVSHGRPPASALRARWSGVA
jgi:DNA gyrase subunit B